MKKGASASLPSTGNKDKDRELLIFLGNYLRDEFIPLLMAKYQELHGKDGECKQEQTEKYDGSNWDKHYHMMELAHDWQKIMPRRITERFHEKYLFLSETERWICCLIYFGFRPSEIAKILGCRSATIYILTSKIRRKLNIPQKTSITRFLEDDLWIE